MRILPNTTKFDLLEPGIRAYAKSRGAALCFGHGFVPFLRVKNDLRELSVERLDEFFDEGDYYGINEYLESVISGKSMHD